MDLLILRNLKEYLYRKYVYFQREDLIVDRFNKENPQLYIYSPLNTFEHLSGYRLNQIIKYINHFLRTTKQEGVFYVGGSCFKI